MSNHELTEEVRARAGELASLLADRHGLKLKRSGDWLNGNCPWRSGSDSDSFGVNAEHGGWRYHATGEHGDAFDLAGRLLGLDPQRQFIAIRDECAKLLGLDTGSSARAVPDGDPLELFARRRGWTVEALRTLGAEIREGGDAGPEVWFPMWSRIGKEWQLSGHRRRLASNGKFPPPTPGGKMTKALTAPAPGAKPGRKAGLVAGPWPIPPEGPVIVCEGEADAAAIIASGGLRRAVAVVAVTSASISEHCLLHLPALLGGRDILLMMQGDSASTRARELLASRLDNAGCRIWWVPEVPGLDIDEVLRRGEDRPSRLRELLSTARRHIALTEAQKAVRGAGIEPRPLTDQGNAERLAAVFHNRLIYIPSEGGWAEHRHGVWIADPANACALRAAGTLREIVGREMEQESDRKRQDLLAAFQIRVQSAKAQKDALALLHGQHGMQAGEEEFDADPHLLNCRNGVVDLRTGELRPHKPGEKFLKQINLDYDPDAPAPRWRRFLEEVYPSSPELQAYMRRVLGYAITGHTKERKFWILIGVGSNGKDTMLGAIEACLGPYVVRVEGELFLDGVKRNADGPSPETAKLKGVRVAICSELPPGKQLSQTRLKNITGGDRLTARRVYGKTSLYWEPTHTLLVATNYKPDSQGDDALWDRTRIIEHNERFDGAKADPHLKGTLAEEAQGILADLVRGAVEWHAEGLGEEPAEVRRASASYRKKEDTLGMWIEDACVCDAHARGTVKELYTDYREWSFKAGERIMRQKDWKSAMLKRGFQDGGRLKRGMALLGIGLAAADSQGSLVPETESKTEAPFFQNGSLESKKQEETEAQSDWTSV